MLLSCIIWSYFCFSGITVFAQGAAATPVPLLSAMTEVGKTKKLQNITVCHMHTDGPADYTDPSCEGIFRCLRFYHLARFYFKNIPFILLLF